MDLDSTLDAIDAATSHPDERLYWRTEVFLGGEWSSSIEEPLGPTTIEWRHPYLGEVVEPLCDVHVAEVRAALKALAIAHAGRRTDPPAGCHRCVDKREPRAWIDRFVDPRGSR